MVCTLPRWPDTIRRSTAYVRPYVAAAARPPAGVRSLQGAVCPGRGVPADIAADVVLALREAAKNAGQTCSGRTVSIAVWIDYEAIGVGVADTGRALLLAARRPARGRRGRRDKQARPGGWSDRRQRRSTGLEEPVRQGAVSLPGRACRCRSLGDASRARGPCPPARCARAHRLRPRRRCRHSGRRGRHCRSTRGVLRRGPGRG